MKQFFSIAIFLCISWFALAQTQTGTASFYADKFNGRKTSSGEVFSQKKFTCAHKTYAFGTELYVRNLSNDSTVIVTVNDRLPKSSKRIIDLTKAAAAQLNFIPKGLTKVEVTVVIRPTDVPTLEAIDPAKVAPADTLSNEKP